MNRPGVNAVQANIITSKLQQQIKTLQNQITAQQQMYVKQAPSNMPNPNDYLRSPTDPIINAFPDLNIGGKTVSSLFFLSKIFANKFSRRIRAFSIKAFPAWSPNGKSAQRTVQIHLNSLVLLAQLPNREFPQLLRLVWAVTSE